MLTFNIPLKEVQGEDKKQGTLCSGKNQNTNKQTKNRTSDSQMFSGKDFYESKFLHLLIPRETLMSRTNVWTWFSWLAPQQLSYVC